VYYPVRTLVLFVGEAFVVWLSLFIGALLNVVLRSRDGWLQFNNAVFIEGGRLGVLGLNGGGYLKLLAFTGIVLFLSHTFDLYDSSRVDAKEDQWWGILFVGGFFTFLLSLLILLLGTGNVSAVFPAFWGLLILVFGLFGWRSAYSWLVQHQMFRERLYVLGTGERAERLIRGLSQRSALGMDVVGSTANIEGHLTRDSVASHLLSVVRENKVHRVIVAMEDRRKTLPVEELLDLRLHHGVKIEDATSWLERINGKIETESLYPSWLIFAEGFRFSRFNRLIRRFLNLTVALIGSVLSLPLLPWVALLVKLSSPGPVLYRQKRVGRGGTEFNCYKFRTMRRDAEADTGATWALDNDPRITRVGRILRMSRLDEIPQLWCVLKGDMHFVGPRPERPEFVEMLSREVPYYGVRHMVRPGITGWAQVQYKYGNTIEDAREKLQYDLFYIKNASVGLDFWIVFQTLKIVLLGRGAK